MNLSEELAVLRRELEALESFTGERLAALENQWFVLHQHIFAIDAFVDHCLKTVRVTVDSLDDTLEQYRDRIIKTP